MGFIIHLTKHKEYGTLVNLWHGVEIIQFGNTSRAALWLHSLPIIKSDLSQPIIRLVGRLSRLFSYWNLRIHGIAFACAPFPFAVYLFGLADRYTVTTLNLDRFSPFPLIQWPPIAS